MILNKQQTIISLRATVLLVSFFSGFHCSSQDTFVSTIPHTKQIVKDTSSLIVADTAPGRIQDSSFASSEKRLWIVGAGSAAAYAGTLAILDRAWYTNYPRQSFHTFNDNKEWLQVDKVGHTWTAYNTGYATAALWRWAGLSPEKAAIVGGLSGVAFLTTIEYLDGRSAKWGWSWGDMIANVTGSGLFIAQELAWQEQRVQFKFSFHNKKYKEDILEKRADDLFGNSWNERMLKDYNGQTYWLSANLKSFFKESKLPPWLNVAAGHGADGMFGGFENKWTDETGADIFRTDIPRKRQFYLAPDIDFTKIKTNKKWVKSVLFCLNAFKCPAPALMLDSKGKMKAYILYF